MLERKVASAVSADVVLDLVNDINRIARYPSRKPHIWRRTICTLIGTPSRCEDGNGQLVGIHAAHETVAMVGWEIERFPIRPGYFVNTTSSLTPLVYLYGVPVRNLIPAISLSWIGTDCIYQLNDRFLCLTHDNEIRAMSQGRIRASRSYVHRRGRWPCPETDEANKVGNRRPLVRKHHGDSDETGILGNGTDNILETHSNGSPCNIRYEPWERHRRRRSQQPDIRHP